MQTTFAGSRREQSQRWRALSMHEPLEALDKLIDRTERTRAQPALPLKSNQAKERSHSDS